MCVQPTILELGTWNFELQTLKVYEPALDVSRLGILEVEVEVEVQVTYLPLVLLT